MPTDTAATVTTAQGTVQGEQLEGHQVFRGIPYAAPPLGDLRFRGPQPPQPWEGTLDATGFGPIAMQNPSPLENILGAQTPQMSEDCLTLNVWTPAADDKQRPVMVWIHGGAFVTGSGSTPWYDGTSFATRGDVVVVTINYRLGALGFLYAEELGATGNQGILDQVAALEWVRDNIAAFGGDPGNVTIFGESAGAMSVGTLLGLPAAKGLFHKAIPQSGAAHNTLTAEQARRITGMVLEELGLQPDQTEQLRTLPVDRLLQAQAAVTLKAYGSIGLACQPVVDGVVLPQRPIDAIAEGSADGVAVLIGTTADEMKLFTLLDPRLSDLDRDKLIARCDVVFEGCNAEDALAAYVAKQSEDARPVDIYAAIETDHVFRVPAIRLAERQTGHGAPTYMYLFTWETPVFDGRLGSCHALEIPFVFNNLHARGAHLFTGKVDDDARRLGLAMHDAWLAFARTGNPNHDGIPEWPTYDHDHRATMVFGTEITVENDPESELRHLWENVL